MKTVGELIRITTKDNLELQGILFESAKKTEKILIHIHGWTGNFYENLFLDYIAKEALLQGFTFLSFNNRGAGIITDFIKRGKSKTEYQTVGGNIESFEQCLFDIKAAIDFVESKGYKTIILQGHSLGCQKATFYQYKKADKRVKGLILLAPVDDVNFTKRDLGVRYNKALTEAKKLIKKGKQLTVPKWMAFSPMLSAEVFLNIADPKSLSGRLLDYSGKLLEVQSIKMPVLAVFGSADKYVINPIEELKVLKNKLENCDTVLIEKAGHGFAGFEKELSNQIGKWLKKIDL